MDVVDFEITDEGLDLAFVAVVELRGDEFAQLGDDIYGSFGLGEVFFDFAGDEVVLEAEFLPSDSGHLVDHDHDDLVDIDGLRSLRIVVHLCFCIRFVGVKGGRNFHHGRKVEGHGRIPPWL